MKIKFEQIRIGKSRRNYLSEKILKLDSEFLKKNIRSVLSDLPHNSERNEITIIIVLPSKGFNVKFALQKLDNQVIKEELKKEFPKNIYQGKRL